MSQLFFRNGTEFKGTPSSVSATRTTTLMQHPCGRCGGAGGSDKWAHTGWTCFQCGGSGKGAWHAVSLYTQDKLDKLNAIAARKAEAAQQAAAARHAAAERAADERRASFEAQHEDILRWLRAQNVCEGFLFDMRDVATRRSEWSEAQSTAVYAARDKALERSRVAAASQHVGVIGDRLRSVAVVVEHVHTHWSTTSEGQYGNSYHGLANVTYITTLRDEAGNCLVVMSSSFCVTKGDRLVITGSVSEHSDFRGQAQTRLKRVKIERKITAASTFATRKQPTW